MECLNDDWAAFAVTGNIEYPVFYQLPYRVLERAKIKKEIHIFFGENECNENKYEIVASGSHRGEQWTSCLEKCVNRLANKEPDSDPHKRALPVANGTGLSPFDGGN